LLYFFNKIIDFYLTMDCNALFCSQVADTSFNVRITERSDMLIAVRIIEGSYNGGSDNRGSTVIVINKTNKIFEVKKINCGKFVFRGYRLQKIDTYANRRIVTFAYIQQDIS
jgi:hypothetical protein